MHEKEEGCWQDWLYTAYTGVYYMHIKFIQNGMLDIKSNYHESPSKKRNDWTLDNTLYCSFKSFQEPDDEQPGQICQVNIYSTGCTLYVQPSLKVAGLFAT